MDNNNVIIENNEAVENEVAEVVESDTTEAVGVDNSEELKALSKAQQEQENAGINWKNVWDHFTTGLLIALMVSPILILAYIFLWFVI